MKPENVTHVATDPLCVEYREPRRWWARRRFDRARGRVCRVCVIPPEVTA